MRLICPRCGAQYEVDDVVIPAAGRDVQCSGCGQTWFQPSRAMLDAAQEQARDDADRLDGWDVAEGTNPEPAPDPDPEAWPEPRPEDWPEIAPQAPPAESPVPADTPPGPDSASVDDAEILDWAVPDVAPPAEPEPAELEPDVTQAIAELMRAHPVTLPPEPEPEPEPQTEPEAAPPPAQAAVPAPPPEPSEVGPAPRAGAIPRRPLDENLLAILREEAEREAAARRAEGGDFETQQEMNLDPVLTPPPAAPRPVTPPVAAPVAAAPEPRVPETMVPPPRAVTPMRVAPPRRVPDFSDLNSVDEDERHADLTESPDPESSDPDGPETPGKYTRRQRLPDIDEINSSLRASADRAGDIAAMGMAQTREESPSGFRLGFSAVLLLAALAALAYAYAPQLARTVPALGPALDGYVTAVDAARIWLDAQLRAVIAAVQAGSGPQS